MFAGGPVEVMDFLLPLWAASDLNASPSAIGLVWAISAAVSLVVRPLAGALADREDRRLVAAGGATLFMCSFVVYALAPTISVVAVGAAVGGAGGALFWVGVDAEVGYGLQADPAAYARLLSSEQLGSLISFAIALGLLGASGYRPLFLVGAAACASAVWLLLSGRSRLRGAPSDERQRAGLRAVGAGLWPLLALTALTAGAEAGLWLILLLHLQSAFDLTPQEIALLFLPGAIVLVVAPERAYELAVRLGRSRSLLVSLLASAAFTASLALGGGPLVVALMWALSAACLSMAVPVEQSTVAHASQGSLGRGTSLYQAAALLGTMALAPAAAALYGSLGWSSACLILAAALLGCALLVRLALRALKLPDALTSDDTEIVGQAIPRSP